MTTFMLKKRSQKLEIYMLVGIEKTDFIQMRNSALEVYFLSSKLDIRFSDYLYTEWGVILFVVETVIFAIRQLDDL